MTRSSHWPDSSRSDTFSHGIPLKHPFTNGEPLPTSTALVPAPDSLISPSIATSLPFYSSSSQKSDKIDEDDSELCPAKLKTIKTKAHEKEGQSNESLEKSIFLLWVGAGVICKLVTYGFTYFQNKT